MGYLLAFSLSVFCTEQELCGIWGDFNEKKKKIELGINLLTDRVLCAGSAWERTSLNNRRWLYWHLRDKETAW